MLVSIVTPSFNQGRYLRETIESVLGQTYDQIEYMVIDGASDDETVSILEEYEDRLAFWVSEPDDGQAAAVNKGWGRATGDILSFLNSDDVLEPRAVEAIVEAFQENPDVGVVYGQGVWTDERGAPVGATQLDVDGQAFLDELPGLPQPATFVRRSLVERVGALDPSFHFALDGEFFCRAVGNARAVALATPLARMRLHPESKSVASGRGFADEVQRLACRVVGDPSAYPRYIVVADEVIATGLMVAGRFEMFNGAPARGLRHWASAAALSRRSARHILLREFPKALVRLALGERRYRSVHRFKRQRGGALGRRGA